MKTQKHSLKKIVSFLNNAEEDGGFWLPKIQRAFIWKEDQICRLFDSIMREYPISTLLIWKTKDPFRCRKFIDNYKATIRLSTYDVPANENKKCLILDGQQRLQSLFIGLCGSYEGRELYFDILSGQEPVPDDTKYKFAFLDSKDATFPWIKFKDLVFSDKAALRLHQHLIKSADRDLDNPEQERIAENVSQIYKTFRDDDGISYQELDSIDDKELYKEDDVVEIFIRANSGGTYLGKSDLLFALLTASWDDSVEKMEDLLSSLNRPGFAFTRDFVLKTCLALLDQRARYEVSKFRNTDVRKNIEQKWDSIKEAIQDVSCFLHEKTFIRCDKAIPSYLALIPLIYTRYHFPDSWRQSKDLNDYLLRSLLTGAFSGTPDQLIDKCVIQINEDKGFNVKNIYDVIRSRGRSLELTEERFWQICYGSDSIHLLFNLWYRNFNYIPAYENNLPQVDHIFPQTKLKEIHLINPDTGKNYQVSDRNQLANCMLLTQKENGPGAGGKSATLPKDYFADKSENYLVMHLIPRDKNLWKIENFNEFIVARKKLIREKFSYLMVDKIRPLI